jgi:PEP-CTERM motif
MTQKLLFKAVLIALFVAVLAVVRSASAGVSAVTISISDLTDGNPVVSTGTLRGPVVSLSFERALITGLLDPVNSSGPIPVGTRSLIFDEPSSDPLGPRLSDFITLTAGELTGTGCLAPFPSGPCQNISILFESDGAPNFDQHIAALPVGTPHLLETGTLQNVTALLNSPANSLQIFASSDLATAEVPEPTSMTLIGAGLILLAAIGKRVRS